MGELIWTRRYAFRSVHALNTGVLKERRHGHHYQLEVSFSGREIDVVDEIVERYVLRELGGRELVNLNPSTGEHIVDWIFARLRATELKTRLKAVALQETRKNRFVASGSEARYV